MKLFSFNKKNNSALEIKEPAGKLYRTVNTVAIVGIFMAVTILILAIAGIAFKMSSFMFGVIGTIAIVCASLILMLPWVNKFEKTQFKKVSLIFMIAIGVCGILWLVCLYMGISVYNKVAAGNQGDNNVIGTINFVKISLILSVQLMVASVVATGTLKYKKSNYFLQGICYLSYAYFDFYVTFLLACIKFSKDKIVEISEALSILGNKTLIVLLVLAVIFIAISNVIMNRDDSRKLQDALVSVIDKHDDQDKQNNSDKQQKSEVEQKLENLKEMYDKNLITKEEYESKRQDILKDF